MLDQFSRIEQLLGSAAMEKIKRARVAVFGLGAVGSFTVEALARSGVGYLRLVDFDRVDATNINRQLYALTATVGEEKAALAKKRVKEINPVCDVAVYSDFVNAENLAGLLSPDLDMVVDAIDGLNSKVNLIVEAKQMGIKIVSSMGAAGRTDFTMIRTGDLFDTTICPLARVVRRRLRRRGVETGVPCIYSIEPPKNNPPFKQEDVQDTQDGHGRPRPPIGSVVWVPGAFGLALAGETIQTLIQE